MDQQVLQRGLRAAREALKHRQYGQAAELLAPIVALDERNIDARLLLSRTWLKQRRLDEALECIEEALVLAPKRADLYSMKGRVLAGLNRLDASLRSHERATSLEPNDPQLLLHLGIAQRRLGQNESAAQTFERACRENPNLAHAFHQRGHTLRVAGDHDGAAEAYRRAIEIRPGFIEARNNLAITLKQLGRHRDALACFDEALELAPQHRNLVSNRLYGLHFNPDFSREQILQEHLKWGKQQSVSQRLHRNSRDPHRKLRVAYLSPDFREHCQRFFTLPLLRNHCHEQFEIIGYHDARVADSFTEQVRGLTNEWRDVSRDTDERLAEMIVEDRIDILVELTQHMANNRLPMLSRRPAPIVVSWLGYPGPTGSPAIDYRFTDPRLDPTNDPRDPTLRLTDTFWCYDPLSDLEVSKLPADANGHITFGCLNNFCKVTDLTLGLWSPIFNRMPDSRLTIIAPKGNSRTRIVEKLKIDPQRVHFLDVMSRDDYLRAYAEIDLCLDTFPYNGHTTSLDALWMGVPVVSLFGDTTVSRAGLSQAHSLGQVEWVTDDRTHFVDLAIALANDLPRLRTLRQSLRERMRGSPLMDGMRFARSVETCYRDVFQRWCAVDRAL